MSIKLIISILPTDRCLHPDIQYPVEVCIVELVKGVVDDGGNQDMLDNGSSHAVNTANAEVTND